MTWEPLPGDAHEPLDLGGALARLQRTLGLARPDAVTAIQQHWTSLLGSELAAVSRLESLHHDTLVVAVDDPAVAEHLRWSANDLLGAVNAVCGGKVATELSVRVRPRRG